jgi:WD40 repeat protein
MAGLALAIALALAACGGSSDENEAVPTAGDGAVIEETVPTEAGGDADVEPSGVVEEIPVEDDLASVPLLEPALEIEVGATDEPKSIALSPDGSLVAVLGGGPFRDVDIFLRVYDTTTGELTNDISFDDDTASVGRIFWTADNRLIGLDTVSFETRVVTWDGATFEVVDSFVMDDFVCLDAIAGFDRVAGAIFAFQSIDDSSTLCRRDLSSDTVVEARPLANNQELEFLQVVADGSALVGEVWDRDAQQYLLVRFDPTTLELRDSEVLDPDRFKAAGVGVELIEAAENLDTRERALSLRPSGVAVPSELDRPRFSPDGSLLWAVSDETEVLIDVSTGAPIGQFELGRGHLYYAWSADGSVLVNPTLGTTLQVFRP